MYTTLKWIGIGGMGLFTLLSILLIVVYLKGTSGVYARFDVEPAPLEVPTSLAAVDRGEHIAKAVAGCTACHGQDLSGTALVDDDALAVIWASNLTSGEGGVVRHYTDEDWVRAIRHGVAPDGSGLVIMPSKAFSHLSADDLGAVIAYVKSVPPVDAERPRLYFRAFGRLLTAVGAFGELVNARAIDHSAPFPEAPDPGPTAEYGAYLASVAECSACHGKDYAGAQPGEPGAPLAPNLTQGGDLQAWSEQEFISTIRTGTTPAGKRLDPQFMPWETFSQMTDEELRAVWAFLGSQAPQG